MPASLPPDTPADISVFFEDGKYCFRVGESMSIYFCDRDVSGTPSCTDECSRTWSPVIASPGSRPVGDWTLVKRLDRTLQWRYRNRPVYTYLNDKPGTAAGDGIDGVWHLVVP